MADLHPVDLPEAVPHGTVPEGAHPEAVAEEEAAAADLLPPEDHHLEVLPPEGRHLETNLDQALALIPEEEEMDPKRGPVLDETTVTEGVTPEIHTDPILNLNALFNPHNKPSRTPLKPSVC